MDWRRTRSSWRRRRRFPGDLSEKVLLVLVSWSDHLQVVHSLQAPAVRAFETVSVRDRTPEIAAAHQKTSFEADCLVVKMNDPWLKLSRYFYQKLQHRLSLT